MIFDFFKRKKKIEEKKEIKEEIKPAKKVVKKKIKKVRPEEKPSEAIPEAKPLKFREKRIGEAWKINLLIVLDELKLEKAKTKFLTKLIENWKLKIENFKEGSVLITLPDYDKNLILAARNLPEVDTIWARNLNVLDLLTFKYLIMPKESIKVIKETFLKSIK